MNFLLFIALVAQIGYLDILPDEIPVG